MLYSKYVEPYPDKKFITVAYIDNFLKLPMFGHLLQLNITVIQVGSSTVFIFLKNPIFTTVLLHFLHPKEKYYHTIYQEAHTSKWMPYWLSGLIMKIDSYQVSHDMYLWESKKFARKLYYK